ncbi:hypothetical protein PCANC_25957 [Puccinia coronata f. sp. avenae]|uniref:Uncharacterized protein n=1 Tax=Puccinia coronata f. sp. avenae TaxID=200324 RepID=A0A2N5THF0_9BASI|nr:hypothetical protein PCANC_25957 [Puccinia coronata f. sp. avenae]PLW31327.1 hypothetical protein PCASD_13661 [Puccinia coronata f. sp. avenae]
MHPGHLNPCDPNTRVGDCEVPESLCCRNHEWFWDELYHIAGVISPQSFTFAFSFLCEHVLNSTHFLNTFAHRIQHRQLLFVVKLCLA